MTTPEERWGALEENLSRRVLVLDGAMGTMLQQQRLAAADFGGPALEGCNENLVRTRPDVVLGIHRAYLAAGADLIETNSFGGARLVLDEYGLGDDAFELNLRAARLARQAAAEFCTTSKPRFVAGAIGPTTKAISVTGGVTFSQLIGHFEEQARALVEGGADVLLVETCQDTRNVKAALIAIERLRGELGRRVPVMVSGTIEPTGTMLAGQTTEAFCASILHAGLLSVGLNCATGPEFMTDHLRTLDAMAPVRISCHPNAGLPNEEGVYLETPESLASQLERFVDRGWLNIVGGCCGTNEAHIRLIAQMAEGKRPRACGQSPRAWYAGIELVEASEDNRPLIVAERTNVIGSQLFKKLVAGERWEEAAEIARTQVRNGAHIIDVCLQTTDRNELADIPPFYERLIRIVKAPLMIDTTDPKALALALEYCQGKSIINSINLEDGEEKFERVCPIARRFGAAIIVGTIDEDKVQAQAFTRERKLAVAERSFRLLTAKYGIPPENIIIDPLVFPCATGDANYAGGAVETIEAIRLIKEQLPRVKIVLGISNISFGLPTAAREVVNSVFLYHATKAGLDLAIVNAERLERFASIPEQERRLAENLLFNTPIIDSREESLRTAPEDWREQEPKQRMVINQFHIGAITEHFRRAARRSAKAPAADLPLEERLARYIVEGTKDGLKTDLDRKLAEGSAPLDIINGPLMAGMAEVGRLFNNNELIVAEVLQSAEAMKAAVSHLEQFMERADAATRGTVILATVKGDVHDIGKNLVEIILANNGYRVINLGIKVPPETLISAYFEHRPDVIGLSGLLVKSSQQMAITAGDLAAAGIRVPLLVGGAALSERFTRTKIAPAYGQAVCYAKDAMTGLRLMNGIMDPTAREAILAEHRPCPDVPTAMPPPAAVRTLEAPSTRRSVKIRTEIPIPPAPYLDRRLRGVPHLAEVWSYINPQMLFGRHLGYRGNFAKDLAAYQPKALEVFHRVEELKEEAARLMKVRAVWQFFPAEREGNAIHLFAARRDQAFPAPAELPLHTFRFPRQPRENGLCLSDYILDAEDGRRDHLALFVVTAGAGIREQSEQWKRNGEFFKAHGVQALALETAEACAEWLHRRIREDWGFPDAPGLTMQDRFTARYRGKRYSFGYPACPNLEDQQGIWKLLEPEEIGVALTEGMMMDPEASVSALVFHHPDCIYFNAAE
jgi:5-methyltetrahydrofolate--homocysteine methyltransferase